MRWLRKRWRAAALTGLLVMVAGLDPVDTLAGKVEVDRRASRRLLGEAKSAIAAGNAIAARSYLDSLQAVDPGSQDVPYLGAQLRLVAADTVGAETLLAKGMERFPLSPRYKLLFTRILLARGRSGEAADLVFGVLAVSPGNQEAGYLQGSIALANADTVLALDLWESVLEAELEGGK